MQPRNRRVGGVDGLTLNLVDWGGDGAPLLLLHGYGHGARLWDSFVPELTSRYRVLALDNRGHGLSEHDPAFRYHNAAIARDVEAVALELDLEGAVVVGHSQGAHAAIRLAGRHPKRVGRLVLAEAGPDGSVASGSPGSLRLLRPVYPSEADYAAILGELYPDFPEAAARSLAHHLLGADEEGGFSPRLDPRFLSGRSKKAAEQKGGFDRVAWAKKEEGRFWHYLAQITCPTLVMRGEDSPMLPADALARICNEVLDDARGCTLAGAGHSLMLDNPGAFREELRAFLL